MDYKALLKKFTDKGIKEGSAKVYITKFKRLMKELFEDVEENDNITTKDYIWIFNTSQDLISKQILEYINKPEVSIYEKENLLKGFLKCIEVLEVDSKVYQENFKLKMTDLLYDKCFQESTQKEEDNKLSQDELIKLREEWKSKITDKFTKFDLYFVLLSLYTYLPPLRAECYYNTKLYYIPYDPDINNLVIEDKKLYLNKYKTASAYGPKIIDIPNKLCEILRKFKDKSNSDYVICSPTGHKLEANSFNRLFKEATKGKKFSCNMSLKCYVSDGIENNKSIEERKQDAKIMGHSIQTAQVFYSKFNRLLNRDEDSLDALIEQQKLLNKLQKDLQEKIMNKLKLI
jgi:hypothetical protein